jgi:hypothetical protein
VQIKTRVTVLTAATALVVAIVRHGVQHKWTAWDNWALIPVSWFIHWFALMFLAAVSGALINQWHAFFLGVDVTEDDTRYQYYTAVIVLLITAAIAILSLWPVADDL